MRRSGVLLFGVGCTVWLAAADATLIGTNRIFLVQQDNIREKSVKQLILELDSKDPLISFTAFSRLGELGPKAAEAVPQLLSRAIQRKDSAAIWTLGRIGPPSKEAVPFLMKLVKARIDGGPENDEKAYADSKYGPWTDSIKALGGIGPESKAAVPLLIALMKDPSPNVRCDVAEAIGLIGPNAGAAVPILIEATNDKTVRDWTPFRFEVRRSAIIALGLVGPEAKSAIPVLIKNLRDPDDSIRHDSLKALGQIGPAATSAVPHLITALQDDSSAKLRAIVSLGEIGHSAKDALPALRLLLKRKDEPFRKTVLEAIQRIEKQ